jgi:hypothetical protein
MYLVAGARYLLYRNRRKLNWRTRSGTPGVDILLVGTGDLTEELGIHGQHDHPQITAAYETVAAACRTHRRFLGVAGIKGASPILERLYRQGARFFSAKNDETLLLAGIREETRALRRFLPLRLPASPAECYRSRQLTIIGRITVHDDEQNRCIGGHCGGHDRRAGMEPVKNNGRLHHEHRFRSRVPGAGSRAARTFSSSPIESSTAGSLTCAKRSSAEQTHRRRKRSRPTERLC